MLAAAWAGSAQLPELAPNRPGTAVLKGAPNRPLTDPRSLSSESRPNAKPIPVADALSLRSSWFATWTPDGRDIIMSSDLAGRVNLWRTSSTGGFPQQLQQSEDKSFYPAVSHDGRTILYASDVGGGEIFDIYALPAAGGAPVNLTQSKDASDTGPFVFSADDKQVAFNRRVAKEPSTNVALLSLETGKVRLLTKETEPGIYWQAIGFKPGSKTLIANRSDITNSSIWSIDVATGAKTRIAGGDKGYDAAASISPDGRFLSATSENAQGIREAVLLDLSSGKRTVLVPSAWPQSAAAISPDGGTVLFVSNVNGTDEVFAYDLARRTARKLDLPRGKTSDYFGQLPAFSPDGRRLLFPHSSASAPFDYWTYDLSDGRKTRITNLGLATIDASTLPKSQIVNYPSADGTIISAFLWMPYNLKRDGSAPVVVVAHGGPTGQTEDSFDAAALALASRGYIVIAPNVRGSIGYGRAFEEANRRDLGGRDLEDEAWGAKFLIDSGYADPKKIGITGGSYGGYMTLIAVARMPDFWAAGVEEYGIVNWRTMWERGSPALREYQRGLIGDPAKDADVYDRTSPLTYLHQVKAPLLVLQGENDIRVPAHEARQVVEILKKAGKTVDSKFYPEEGHGFLKRENQVDALQRKIDWFDRYLKGAIAR